MRCIDADKLKPDCLTKDGKFAVSQNQIANALTVNLEKRSYIEGYKEGCEEGKRCYERPQGGECMTELIPLNPDNRGYTDIFKCDKCGAYIHTPYDNDIDFRFCPYCGEKVKEY